MLTVDFRLLDIGKGEKILDAGCGEGRHAFEACRADGCGVCALDLSQAELRKTKYVLNHMDDCNETGSWWVVMKGDVLNLPFKDDSFDKIICSEVLEHVKDDEQGIGELVRVLKKGGMMAVTVPTYLSESIYWALSEDYHNHPGGHIRKYQAQQLIAALRRNNLRIFALRWEHAFHTVYWLLRCIFGLKNESALIPSLYYYFLEQEIISQSRFVGLMEGVCNFFFPKSIVIYTQKI